MVTMLCEDSVAMENNTTTTNEQHNGIVKDVIKDNFKLQSNDTSTMNVVYNASPITFTTPTSFQNNISQIFFSGLHSCDKSTFNVMFNGALTNNAININHPNTRRTIYKKTATDENMVDKIQPLNNEKQIIN